ncbi:MAG: hypothetical protein WBQ85_08765 [Candidatus Sulfotelmatobacter sp.]
MSSSHKKAAANRINGQKSDGPTNTTSTRFNATKHGLLAVGITELDNAEGYRNIQNGLMREKNPVGAIETFLVESAAIEMVRWLRARRLEAECITSELNPPTHSPGLSELLLLDGGEVLDPGLPAAISAEAAQKLVTFQRYESTFANRFFRIIHELERLQRMRQGERLPVPVAVDISVHAGTGALDPVGDDSKIVESVSADKLEKSDSVRLKESAPSAREGPVDSGIGSSVLGAMGRPKSPPCDMGVHADTAPEDPVPATTEQPRALPEDNDGESERIQ